MGRQPRRSEEHDVDAVPDRLHSSRSSRLALFGSDLRLDGRGRRQGGLFRSLIIHPDNKLYRLWTRLILVLAVYSSFFTPFEFAFFRGLPRNLFLDIAGQIGFLIDIVLKFFTAYHDLETNRITYHPTSLALRYCKSTFIFDLLGCFPWDAIYKACGNKGVRYLLWIRLIRALKVTEFCNGLEKDIRVNYLFTRIVKLIVVELYCTHTAACIFYYLATTLPESKEGSTWIGSLQLGDYSYSNFREIDLARRYVTSLYFAIVTMATVAYLVGNFTALIVKGSRLERFRDKLKEVSRYMNRNELGNEIREQVTRHLTLQYESSYTDAAVLQDIPISIRAKNDEYGWRVKQLESDVTFHIEKQEAELALRVNSAACYGDLDDLKSLVRAGADPKKTDYDERSPLHLAVSKGHEDVAKFLIHQGADINLTDKFGNTPLLEAVKQGHDQVASLLFSKGAKLGLKNAGTHLCTAVSTGDSDFIRRALAYGADPNSKDYDHRTPLHVAAAEGLLVMAKILLGAGASVLTTDRWGTTPLDDGHRCGSKPLVTLLEQAKTDELSRIPMGTEQAADKLDRRRRCSVFPNHPWDADAGEKRRHGVVLWVPHRMEELVRSAQEKLGLSASCLCLLCEDGATVQDVDMVDDGQKLYLVRGEDAGENE